jgi:hypothetical protein
VTELETLLIGALTSLLTGIGAAFISGKIRFVREIVAAESARDEWRKKAEEAEGELKAQTKDSMILAQTTAENQKLFAASLDRFSRLISHEETTTT